SLSGLTWLIPLARLAGGENPRLQAREFARLVSFPLIAIVLFLAAWSLTARRIDTSLGALPGPAAVWEQARGLWAEHAEERAKKDAFFARQEKRNARILARDPEATVKIRAWTGRPTYLDQIGTSLKTVFTGFLLASLIAVPVGLLCGMSRTV